MCAFKSIHFQHHCEHTYCLSDTGITASNVDTYLYVAIFTESTETEMCYSFYVFRKRLRFGDRRYGLQRSDPKRQGQGELKAKRLRQRLHQ